MKKRIVGFVLMCAVVVSLFAIFAVSANAEMATEIVVIAKGDTLYSLCKARGYNYYSYKELLMRLNRMDSEKQLAKITAGKKIELPKSKEAADELVKTLGIKSVSAAKPAKGAEAFVAGDVTKLGADDKISYYLVNYALKKGEKLVDLYKSWGMKFASYSNLILSLNDMADFNHIPAGKVLILPTTKLDIAGTSYYTVIERTIKKDDTTYNICRSYGLEYNKVLPTLEKLNPKVTFTKIRVGQKLYIPLGGAIGVQVPASPVPTISPVIVLNGEVSGYGIVISSGSKLCIRQQDTAGDVNLTVVAGSLPAGYAPKAGDYVYFTYNQSTGALVSLKYFYNAFTIK